LPGGLRIQGKGKILIFYMDKQTDEEHILHGIKEMILKIHGYGRDSRISHGNS